VLVGAEEERFVVHEEFLTHYSTFFKAALTGGFREAKDKIVKLPDENSSVFEGFVHWVYYRRFLQEDTVGHTEYLANWEKDDLVSGTDVFVRLYIFGDKYEVPKLKEHIIKKWFSYSYGGKLPSPSNLSLVFENLFQRDPFCRLLVDVQCLYGRPTEYDDHHLDEDQKHQWPSQFLLAVLKRYAELQSSCDFGEIRVKY
jgi:hypothetical protein